MLHKTYFAFYWKRCYLDVDAYDEDDLRDTTQTVEVPGQPTAKKPQPVGPGVKKRPFSKKVTLC